jgi:hypothetical protein
MTKTIIAAAILLATSAAYADSNGQGGAPCATCGVNQIGGSVIGEIASVSKSALDGVGDIGGIAKNAGAANLDFSVQGSVNLGSFQGTIKGVGDSVNESSVEATNAAKAAADGTGASVGLGGIVGQAATPGIELPALPALPELPKL